MELEAIVQYGGAYAYYKVIVDGQDMYHARLIRFYGSPEAAPPDKLLLVKGIRRWIGSSDDKEIMGELGRFIDTAMPERFYLRRLSGEPTNPDI
jgi:hypothetical protein